MFFKKSNKKENKYAVYKYVVYKYVEDYIIFKYDTRYAQLSAVVGGFVYSNSDDDYSISVPRKNIVADEICTEEEADFICKQTKYVNGEFKLLKERITKLEQEQALKTVKAVTYKYSDSTNILNNIYVIIGEYPNFSISEKIIMVEDEFNYCLKDKKNNSINMCPKVRCFKTYQEANNEILKLLQKEIGKECKCQSHKKS